MPDFLDELLAEIVAAFFASVQGDEGVNRLALDVVRVCDDRGLRDFRVGDERAFDLGGADTMTRDVDHVVDAAGDPIITVLVAPAAVAGEVKARIRLEIGFEEAAVVIPHGAHLARPRGGNAEVTAGGP